jgi:uncharacterized SAM-binding protein YcdF (DUF218 family)
VLGRGYRITRGALALAMLLQLLLVFTPVTEWLFTRLMVTVSPAKADAIVCLGGGWGRMFWAAELYHAGYAPEVVVCHLGDKADRMKRMLVMCGVPAKRVKVDDASENTAAHPPGVKAVTGGDPSTQRLLLVTDHEHSRRAAACFRKAGFAHVSVYGGPPAFPPGEDTASWRWRVLMLPHIVYEYAGLAQYWLQDRI